MNTNSVLFPSVCQSPSFSYSPFSPLDPLSDFSFEIGREATTTKSDDLRSEEEAKPRPSRACLLLHNSNNPYFNAGTSIALVYNKDVVFKKFEAQPIYPQERSPRQKIFEFSDSSRRRLLHLSRNSGHHIKSQVCLTFHNSCPLNGKAFKETLNIFLVRMRKEFSDLYYLWVLEFQKNGQPHAHFFSNLQPDQTTREKVAKLWVTTVSGSEENYKFTAHKKNFFPWSMQSGSYLVKEYIAKSVQKDVPAHFYSVGRFWGASRNMKPTFTIVDDSLFEVKEIYKKAVRAAYKLYEDRIYRYKKKKCLCKREEIRSAPRTRTLANVSEHFIKLLKYYWFYGPGETGAEHQVFDPLLCPSFEYGVPF